LRKCEKYFNLYRTVDNQKVEGAALYLNGLAETWYNSLVLDRGVVTWAEFKEELCVRFGEADVADIVEEFNKLSQIGTVDEFLGKFEDLKAQMIIRNPALNEAYFLSSFIGALKEEIKFGVKMFKPVTLRAAIEQARLQEKAIEVAQKKNVMMTKTSYQGGGSSSTKNMGSNPIPTVASGSNYSKHATVNNPRPNTFRLTPEVYEYRRSNKLCFRCGEKYYPGHNCKAKQLNCMRGEEEAILPDEIEVPEPPDLIIEGEIQHEVMEAICLSALSGSNQGVNAILVKGSVKNRVLAVLIDSGSTHSFIDEQAVSETGYVAEYSSPMKVTVVDGNYVMCHTSCPNFSWKMGGKSFKENLRIIKLGGCDLVLGNDWMKKNNPTKFDHEKRCVTIGRKSNKTVLHAIRVEGSLSMISGNVMSKLIKKGQTLIAHLFILGGEP